MAREQPTGVYVAPVFRFKTATDGTAAGATGAGTTRTNSTNTLAINAQSARNSIPLR